MIKRGGEAESVGYEPPGVYTLVVEWRHAEDLNTMKRMWPWNRALNVNPGGDWGGGGSKRFTEMTADSDGERRTDFKFDKQRHDGLIENEAISEWMTEKSPD